MRTILVSIVILLFFVSGIFAQARWKRTGQSQPDMQLFHSTYLINLPTAETLQKGDFEFEISHRFVPPVNEGKDALYGLDGPVNVRIALGYAISNKLVATLARSNVNSL